MSRDKKIVVSHDPFTNSDFVYTPEGGTMSKAEGKSRLLYNMDYDSIAKYDVGSKPNPDFPRQKKMKAIKPLLRVLIDSAEDYANTSLLYPFASSAVINEPPFKPDSITMMASLIPIWKNLLTPP